MTFSRANFKGVLGRAVFVLILALLEIAPLVAVDTGTEPKDCMIFPGLNLMIKRGANYFPLIGVTKNGALIRVNGREVPLRFDEINSCRVLRPVVVSDWRMNITHLETVQSYTPAADPRRVWRESESLLIDYQQDQVDAVFSRLRMEEGGLNLVTQTTKGLVADPLQLVPEDGVTTLKMALSEAAGDTDGLDSGAFYDRKSKENLDKEHFDAVSVGFEVSSPLPVQNPYLVMAADYRLGAKSPAILRRIALMKLDPINREPRKVTLKLPGFPLGFVLIRNQIHIYEGEKEIATDATRPRMEVSRTEMFRYLEIQYAAENKGRTLPPVAIRGLSQVTIRDKVEPGQLDQSLKIKVSKDGEVVDWSARGSATVAISVPINSYLRDLHFYPALDNGTPVDGTVVEKLADLAQ